MSKSEPPLSPRLGSLFSSTSRSSFSSDSSIRSPRKLIRVEGWRGEEGRGGEGSSQGNGEVKVRVDPPWVFKGNKDFLRRRVGKSSKMSKKKRQKRESPPLSSKKESGAFWAPRRSLSEFGDALIGEGGRSWRGVEGRGGKKLLLEQVAEEKEKLRAYSGGKQGKGQSPLHEEPLDISSEFAASLLALSAPTSPKNLEFEALNDFIVDNVPDIALAHDISGEEEEPEEGEEGETLSPPLLGSPARRGVEGGGHEVERVERAGSAFSRTEGEILNRGISPKSQGKGEASPPPFIDFLTSKEEMAAGYPSPTFKSPSRRSVSFSPEIGGAEMQGDLEVEGEVRWRAGASSPSREFLDPLLHEDPSPKVSGKPAEVEQDPDSEWTFLKMLYFEIRGRPSPSCASQLPKSPLPDLVALPFKLEKVLLHGYLVCFDTLLYEISMMPLSASIGLLKVIVLGRGSLSLTEKSDLVRMSLLFASVFFFHLSVDFSAAYHFIRAQSLVKLYLLFNMLEIFERIVRSWGCDLLDSLIQSSVASPSGGAGGMSSLPSQARFVILFLLGLGYNLLHTYMHLLRVLCLNVAIVASDTTMFMIVMTNNFAEIKGSVFKKYDSRGMYPIITSDTVERFYLGLDVSLVFLRIVTSPRRRQLPVADSAFWIFVMVVLEVLTDWLKYGCMCKFNGLQVGTFDQLKTVHYGDVLNARTPQALSISSLPTPYRGVMSFSHVTARRFNFMALPLSTLVVCHFFLPDLGTSEGGGGGVWKYRVLLFLSAWVGKVCLSIYLLGLALTRRKELQEIPDRLYHVKAM